VAAMVAVLGGGVAGGSAGRSGGDQPRGAPTPCPPSSLALLGAVDEPSPCRWKLRWRKIRCHGWCR
jgi:hypothetical protein